MSIIYLQRVSREIYEQYRKDHDNVDIATPIYSISLSRMVISHGHHYCLIRDFSSDNIVGTFLYWHGTRGIPHSKIIDIEIHDKFQGNGFGTAAIDLVIDEARSIRSLYISLFVFEHRSAAQHIYSKKGFQKVKQFNSGVSLILVLA